MTSTETHERVLAISIDGLTPRAISPRTTPNLCRLARSGGGCFSARTVVPAVTMPAHTSMLRGVAPDVHGVRSNEQVVGDDVAPSFLALARAAGLTTATVLSWRPMDEMIERGAVVHRTLLDSGYDLADDRRVVDDASTLMRTKPDVSFVYLTGPDLVGHEHGWDSAPYVATVSRVDALLGELVEAAGPDMALVVTTDHGGEGRTHGADNLSSAETFVVVRSRRVPAGSCWERASILDVAPTVADLAGFVASPQWTGRTLLASSRPVADFVLDLVSALGGQDYGEDLDILSHSLQAAAHARNEKADGSLVVAALLHDVGHVLGEATEWGLPGHAEVGAHFLQPWFGAEVVEPIRLHVDAKRSLVATDPDYLTLLSHASRESLRQQGGAFNESEVARFLGRTHAEDAMRLRRWDDRGKTPGLVVESLDSYRQLVADALERAGGLDGSGAMFSPMWARDSCRCAECRDPSNDQHLIGATELDGWRVLSSTRDEGGLVVELVGEAGRRHSCVIPDGSGSGVDEPLTTWGKDHARSMRRWDARSDDELDAFVRDLAEFGIALAASVRAEAGQVLDFARRIGFVRSTNYGDLFDVVAAPDPINLAYTPRGLPLHTDNPYRDPVPTVQVLHCLRPSRSGGASLFSDGFRAAARLREQDREAFEILTKTAVLFRFAADGVDLRAEVPVIGTDADGRVVRVAVNHRSMEPPPPSPDCEAFYRAYTAFVALLADAENSIEITLDSGEIVAFDNRRVLHGRTAFAADPDRHLQGCYVDMDAIRSTARITRRS